MKDWILAIVIGIFITAGIFVIPLVVALLFPAVILAGVIFVVWFLIQAKKKL